MKKVLLLVLFILSLLAKAQTNVYHPFPDSNAVWSVNGWGGEFGCKTFQHFIQGDTIISGNIYHKLIVSGVYYAGHINQCDSVPSYYLFNQYDGCFREDIALKRVYYIYPDSTNEFLLYDFSLTIGDTIPPCLGNAYGYYHYTISSIDSILIDTQYRKRFVIDGQCQMMPIIIEGIGSSFGLLQSFCNPYYLYLYFLGCFSLDNKSVYSIYFPNPFTTCEIITNTRDDTKQFDQFKIFPNPTTDKITITGYHLSGKDAEVTIYNMLGKEMMRKKFMGNRMEIERGSLVSGVYFVRVRSEDRQWVEKVVVE